MCRTVQPGTAEASDAHGLLELQLATPYVGLASKQDAGSKQNHMLCTPDGGPQPCVLGFSMRAASANAVPVDRSRGNYSTTSEPGHSKMWDTPFQLPWFVRTAVRCWHKTDAADQHCWGGRFLSFHGRGHD